MKRQIYRKRPDARSIHQIGHNLNSKVFLVCRYIEAVRKLKSSGTQLERTVHLSFVPGILASSICSQNIMIFFFIVWVEKYNVQCSLIKKQPRQRTANIQYQLYLNCCTCITISCELL